MLGVWLTDEEWSVSRLLSCKPLMFNVLHRRLTDEGEIHENIFICQYAGGVDAAFLSLCPFFLFCKRPPFAWWNAVCCIVFGGFLQDVRRYFTTTRDCGAWAVCLFVSPIFNMVNQFNLFSFDEIHPWNHTVKAAIRFWVTFYIPINVLFAFFSIKMGFFSSDNKYKAIDFAVTKVVMFKTWKFVIVPIVKN